MSIADRNQDLLASEDMIEALAALERGAAAGDASSLYELGLLLLAGKSVVRDIGRAREYFRRAGEAGEISARNIHLQLVGLGAGGPRDWTAAVADLRDLASSNAPAMQQIELLDQMHLTPEGDPLKRPSGLQLSSKPDVWSLKAIFSEAECAYLIARARPFLQPSLIVDPDTGRLRPHPVRTSDGMAFPWVSEDLVTQALNRRIAAATATDVAAGELLQVLRYQPGQEYRPHFDGYNATDNQRVLTMLVYLNEDYEGGETVFTHTGLTFRGRTGDGLVFRNALPDGRRDESSQHAGLQVRSGEKWLASRWIRQRPMM